MLSKELSRKIFTVTEVDYETSFIIEINTNVFESLELAKASVALTMKKMSNYEFKEDEYDNGTFYGENKHSRDEWYKIVIQEIGEIGITQPKVDNPNLQKLLDVVEGSWISPNNEIILDTFYNVYFNLREYKTYRELKLVLILATMRNISKVMDDADATKLLNQVNEFAGTNLTKRDMYDFYGNISTIEAMEKALQEKEGQNG